MRKILKTAVKELRQGLSKIELYWKPRKAKLEDWLRPRQEKLNSQWRNLALRERCLLLGGALTLFLLLFYLGVWSPLQTRIEKLSSQIQHEKKTALVMMQLDTKLQAFETKQSDGSAQKITEHLTRLQEKIQQSPLKRTLTQMTAMNSNELHCTFEATDFDKLMTWLIELSQGDNFTIEQVSIRRMTMNGKVKAEFVFQLR